MHITREVALTEVYLDEQARHWAYIERTTAKEWASEIAKACVWIIGLAIVLVLMLLLAPESKADSVPVGQVSSYLIKNSYLPLAGGVGSELAQNLLIAQEQAWGNVWQTGSLLASENAVLKAITLYVFPGGPPKVTDDQVYFWAVWDQSRIAIDLRLTGTLDPASINFGEVPVGTPEPGTWILLGIAGIGLWIVKGAYRRNRGD